MAAEVCHSPIIVSPRKPLQSLAANVHGTPLKKNHNSPFKKHASPFKLVELAATISQPLPVVSLIPAVEEPSVNPRKRGFEEMQDSQESQPRPHPTIATSFSSLIDYNAKRSSPDAEREGKDLDSSVKERAQVLRLRLQMAFFRVQTNQVQVPIADLQLPATKSEDELDTNNKAEGDAEPQTPHGATRHRSHSESSSVSEPELPPVPGEMIISHDLVTAARKEKDLTSSAVKGRAISGLLESSRS